MLIKEILATMPLRAPNLSGLGQEKFLVHFKLPSTGSGQLLHSITQAPGLAEALPSSTRLPRMPGSGMYTCYCRTGNEKTEDSVGLSRDHVCKWQISHLIHSGQMSHHKVGRETEELCSQEGGEADRDPTLVQLTF